MKNNELKEPSDPHSQNTIHIPSGYRALLVPYLATAAVVAVCYPAALTVINSPPSFAGIAIGTIFAAKASRMEHTTSFSIVIIGFLFLEACLGFGLLIVTLFRPELKSLGMLVFVNSLCFGLPLFLGLKLKRILLERRKLSSE